MAIGFRRKGGLENDEEEIAFDEDEPKFHKQVFINFYLWDNYSRLPTCYLVLKRICEPIRRPLAIFFRAPLNAHVFGAPSPYLWAPVPAFATSTDDQSPDESEGEELYGKEDEEEEKEAEPLPR
jgi:hypothetical protein